MTRDELLQKAETEIQAILLGLENDHGIEIDHVTVDTRNFANLGVQIMPKMKKLS